MAADALAPGVARTTAATVIVWDKPGLKLPVTYHMISVLRNDRKCEYDIVYLQ